MPAGSTFRFLRRAPELRGLGYVLAIVGLALATLARAAFPEVFGGTPYLAFYPVVVAAAAFGGLGPTLLATVGSTLIADVVFEHPAGTLTLFHDPVQFGRSAIFVVSGLVIGLVAEKRRAGRKREQQQLEQLRESEDKFRTVADYTYAWEFWLSPDGRFLYNSPSCKKVTGYDADAFVKDPKLFDRIIHPDDRSIYQEHRGTRNQACTTDEAEFRIIHSDGSIRWLVHACVPVHDRQGKFLGVRGSNRDITADKEAQNALRESEHRWGAFMHHLPGAAWIKDLDGHYIYANPEGERTYGLTLDKLRGMTDEEIFPAKTARQLRENDRLVLTQGRDLHTTEEILQPDGRIRHTLVSKFILKGSTGEPAYTAGIAVDITDLLRAEEELRQSQQRLQTLFDNAGVGILEAREDYRLVNANRRACEILGRSREELLTMNVHQLTWPDDRALSDRVNAELQEGKRNRLEYEKRYVRGDGSALWVHVTVSAIRDESGRLERSIATVEDISERKAAEDALRESESFHRQTLESIPGMVFTTRPDGYCDYQSGQWVEYTGVPMSEHVGEGWNRLLHPEDRPRAMAAWRAAVETNAAYDLEYRVRRRDGEYEWFKAIGRPIRDAEGNVVRWFGTVMNIESLKQTEQALVAAIHSAEQAKAAAEEANQAKDRFLAVLSHELRTPLTPVLAAVSLLQKHRSLEDKTRHDLEMIHRNVELEARLIDDLLDVTRISQGRVELDKQLIQLCSVIHRAVEVCKPDIEARQLEFGVDLGSASPYWVEADAARLQQVFWNLLKNAVKFTPHGGCVGIRCYLRDEQVITEVNDSGTGFEPELRQRIFNAFAQADKSISRQFGGLGLGLAISKSLIELHGGRIEANSPGKGQGASFKVVLPLAGAVPLPPTPKPPPPRQEHKLRLLVVEDHGDTAEMLRVMLESQGHQVDLAGDLEAALDKLEGNSYDLLISDLGLPDGSGLDLMREIVARGHHTPGIALSGYGRESDIQQSRAAGFEFHMTKPVDMDRLMSCISRVLTEKASP